MYFPEEDYTTVLPVNESMMISSNGYPDGIASYDQCVRKFETNKGLFRIRFLDTKVSVTDILAVGGGAFPFFDNAVYGIATAAKSPIRDNHPSAIYIKPAKMWIFFKRSDYPSVFQFSTPNTGFLLEISSVLESGKYYFTLMID